MAVGEPAVEEGDELTERLREVVIGEGVRVAAKRHRRHAVRPGRAADAEIDPSGVERVEHPELLSDDERSVVRQHDPAGADAHRFGGRGDLRDEHGGR